MKKLYVVTNDGDMSDFDIKEDMAGRVGYYNTEGTLYHDAGYVILADSPREARKLMGKGYTGTLTEISQEKSGVVLFANGEC